MNVVFRPRTKSFQDILDVAHAKQLWREKQKIILRSLEKYSGISFKQSRIYVTTGAFSGTHSGVPKRLAMSIPSIVQGYEGTGSERRRTDLELIGTITHELSHHLLLEHNIVAPSGPSHDLEAHKHIYLFLIDVWKDVFGGGDTEKLIAFEAAYDPDGYMTQATKWAKKLSKNQREECMSYLRRHKRLPRTSF